MVMLPVPLMAPSGRKQKQHIQCCFFIRTVEDAEYRAQTRWHRFRRIRGAPLGCAIKYGALRPAPPATLFFLAAPGQAFAFTCQHAIVASSAHSRTPCNCAEAMFHQFSASSHLHWRPRMAFARLALAPVLAAPTPQPHPREPPPRAAERPALQCDAQARSSRLGVPALA